MNWERMKDRLEQVLGIPAQELKLPDEVWEAAAKAENQEPGLCKSVVSDGKVCFFLYKESKFTVALAIDGSLMTRAERELVELMFELYREQGRKIPHASVSDEEKRALLLRDWCNEQLERGAEHAEVPESLIRQMPLHTRRVPFLLSGDYSPSRHVTYKDLKKLLETFFDEQIVLIPLNDKDWLIFGTEGLLSYDSEDKEEEESQEEALASLCFGLSDMLANEWVGECHIAVHPPTVPADSLIAVILALRETLLLGRTFQQSSHIHLPWALRLEKLLASAPENEKSGYLEHVLGGYDYLLDAETISTLETFFQLDCNVSETAKKLYIHRNTLLYRLDKFKQETSLDVRGFQDAVLVKIALQLYKVTKRK
jgi:sugar diacid utilization regulator